MKTQSRSPAERYPRGGDRLSVELSETDPTDMKSTIMINWPPHATITTPASYDNVTAVVTRLLAAASIELAALKARKQL